MSCLNSWMLMVMCFITEPGWKQQESVCMQKVWGSRKLQADISVIYLSLFLLRPTSYVLFPLCYKLMEMPGKVSPSSCCGLRQYGVTQRYYCCLYILWWKGAGVKSGFIKIALFSVFNSFLLSLKILKRSRSCYVRRSKWKKSVVY